MFLSKHSPIKIWKKTKRKNEPEQSDLQIKFRYIFKVYIQQTREFDPGSG